jgi:hypothetical protein
MSVISTQALVTFRRRSDAPFSPPLPAVIVMEPGMFVTAAVTASWLPVSSLQTLNATERTGLATVRPDQAEGRERLLGACVALHDDPVLGPALRSHAVAVEALWFDTVEGDIYCWDAATRRFELLADDGLERFFAKVRHRAASSSASSSSSAAAA